MIQKYILIVMVLVNFNCISQNQFKNSIISESFNSGDFEKCIKDCSKVLSQDESNAHANLFKGASLIRTKKYAEAEVYLIQAKTNNFQPETLVNSNLLVMYAGLQNTAKTISQLEMMVNNGFRGLPILNTQEFVYLKENKEFILLQARVDANANPCKYGKDYKKLDFWLGEWDVYVNGKKSAESYITKSMGGCTLHEDYRTLGGYFGRSYNYYDVSDKLYTQIWVDKFNGKYEFKEKESREDYLSMLADQGGGSLVKMIYEKDATTGNVTQIMETSTDNGKTWTLGFTGVYKKKTAN